MAKADLKNLEIADCRPLIGHAIQRALSLIGWSQKEASGRIGREPAQLARWIAGTERAQLDALWAVCELQKPLVIALAEQCHDETIEVRTVITMPGRRL